MSYFVVVPGALVPASIAPRVLARAKLPRLAHRLQRVRPEAPLRMAGEGAAHLDWLWSRFGAPAERPVTAPYAWRALNRASAIEAPSDEPIWQADLVHFAFVRDHILVSALDPEAAITPDESRALAIEAEPILAEFNATLRVRESSYWFLSFTAPWPLTAVAYDAALGRSAERVLPSGESAARWRKLLTEIQIAWHQHPVNERREAAGMQTINGLWLHGGGVWRELPRRPFTTVATSDAAIGGWALASGLPPSAVLPLEAKPGRGGPALVYWPRLLRFSGQHNWDSWLDELSQFDAQIESHIEHAFAHGFGDVTLVLAGRESVRSVVLRRSDRLRFWQRHPIAGHFAEAETV
jgi:hypothetical protein